MPKPPKLTLAAAEKVARTADPAAWDAMSPADRAALVKQVNAAVADDHFAKARKMADQAKIDRFLRTHSGTGRKRR